MPQLYDPERNEVGKGVPFQRTRRITGYLVGSLSRFGDAKRAEERDRVKHGITDKEEAADTCAPIHPPHS